MHPQVQPSVQDWLVDVQEKGRLVEKALQLLAENFPKGEYENKNACKSLLPHPRAVLQHDLFSEAGLKNKAILLHSVSRFDWREGRYMLAEESVGLVNNIRK